MIAGTETETQYAYHKSDFVRILCATCPILHDSERIDMNYMIKVSICHAR